MSARLLKKVLKEQEQEQQTQQHPHDREEEEKEEELNVDQSESSGFRPRSSINLFHLLVDEDDKEQVSACSPRPPLIYSNFFPPFLSL